MKSRPAVVRLERKLAADPCALLTAAEVRLLAGEVRRTFADSFVQTDALGGTRVEDAIRWRALGARCAEARAPEGFRELARLTGVPQYRLQAIERVAFSSFRPDLAWRYFRYLGVEDFVWRWCRANRELASRTGLLGAAGQPGGRARRGRMKPG